MLKSENSILALIDSYFPNSSSFVLHGRGDDCALLKEDICVSSDFFLEDIHFRKSYFEAEDIAYKSLAVNISDIASCGAKPIAFTCNLGIPSWVDDLFLEKFCKSMANLANIYNLHLIGGDLSKNDNLIISITIFGIKCNKMLFRQKVRKGDILFIIGDIGLSRLGLMVLEKEGRNACKKWPIATKAHLRPTIYVKEGLILSSYKDRISLMDISDGLNSDIFRLIGLNSNLGANININEDNLNKEVIEGFKYLKLDYVNECFIGGEDYALLGACSEKTYIRLSKNIDKIWKLGNIILGNNIICNNKVIDKKIGFDHFSI